LCGFDEVLEQHVQCWKNHLQIKIVGFSGKSLYTNGTEFTLKLSIPKWSKKTTPKTHHFGFSIQSHSFKCTPLPHHRQWLQTTELPGTKQHSDPGIPAWFDWTFGTVEVGEDRAMEEMPGLEASWELTDPGIPGWVDWSSGVATRGLINNL
jgi:hypothetical protein